MPAPPPTPPPAQPPWSYGPPPPWGYAPPPAYGYAGPRQAQTEGLAIVVLVLSIASFVVLGMGVIMAIVALALCPKAKRTIETSGGALTGQSLVTAARVISWVNVGVVVLMVIAFVVFFVIIGAVDESEEFSTLLALGSMA